MGSMNIVNNVVVRFILTLVFYVTFLLSLDIFPSKYLFLIFSIGVYLVNRPVFMLSPRNIIFAYYFLWFGLAPIFADRYDYLDYGNNIIRQSYIYLSSSFITMILISMFVENKYEKKLSSIVMDYNGLKVSNRKLFFTFIASFIFFVLYLINTGGVGYWIENIDRAFLTRQGAGIYYLGFSLFFPLLIFFVRLKYKSLLLLIFLSVLVISLSPFIGSKQKIIYCFLLLFSTFILRRKLTLSNSLMVIFPAVSLFLLGNYFRNFSWMTLSDVASYSFNYFDTLDSLLLFLYNRHYPFEIISIGLPLNKVVNLYTGGDEFFDISAYYTNIYFPEAWNIRATVQFPVEVDLFLSFGFWIGLIPLGVFTGIYSLVFVKMLSSTRVVYGFIWFNLFFYLLSHMRGGLFIWTDLYLYPYLILVYFLFREVKVNVRNE
jgi:hypothetical protein